MLPTTIWLMALVAAGAAVVLIAVFLVARAVLRGASRRVAELDGAPARPPLTRAQEAATALSPEELERFRDWLERRCRGDHSEGVSL
jgi:phosphatidylglycerophosphate synthase